MNAMRESWTDERLDDLNGQVCDLSVRVDHLGGRVDELSVRVDHLGGRVDELSVRVDRLSDRVERGFAEAREDLEAHRRETRTEFKAVRAEMKAGFDGIHRLMIQLAGGVIIALIGVIATLLGIGLTQF